MKSSSQEFQQSMRSESQFLPVPMATRKTENWTVGDVVFFFLYRSDFTGSCGIAHPSFNFIFIYQNLTKTHWQGHIIYKGDKAQAHD